VRTGGHQSGGCPDCRTEQGRMSKIKIPKGWRILSNHETIIEGDRFNCDSNSNPVWIEVLDSIGKKVSHSPIALKPFIRRIKNKK
jgi:hypothetical protein